MNYEPESDDFIWSTAVPERASAERKRKEKEGRRGTGEGERRRRANRSAVMKYNTHRVSKQWPDTRRRRNSEKIDRTRRSIGNRVAAVKLIGATSAAASWTRQRCLFICRAFIEINRFTCDARVKRDERRQRRRRGKPPVAPVSRGHALVFEPAGRKKVRGRGPRGTVASVE